MLGIIKVEARMETIRLGDLLRKYEDMWVALNQQRTQVLASAHRLEDTIKLAQKSTSEEPIFTYVPRLDLDYVG